MYTYHLLTDSLFNILSLLLYTCMCAYMTYMYKCIYVYMGGFC